jgi:DNA mismatch repair protein MutL
MNKIHILPEKVASQIAAGEVVDRPASVVRELIDNSIDAAADRIFVRIEMGGKGLIKVNDNGVGMSRDDILLCVERYATSKIETASDLFSVKSFGFRGEAHCLCIPHRNCLTPQRPTGRSQA